ncbi:MAG: citrate (Si)-synthase [Parachlamydiales bacterium]|jgi:citrate synthase
MAEMTKDDVLLTITKENLETGLRGYPVGYCTTSSVDPQKGLFYVGKSLADMAFWNPENVIFLLFNGREGSDAEIKTFKEDLIKRSHISPEVIKHIHALPRHVHPMKIFCMALLILGSLEGKNDYREDALNLIAKLPQLTATVINFHGSWGGTKPPQPELGYMENFTHMLNTPNADPKALTHAFKLFNVLHFDHGGGNLSAFTGKAVSSGLEDMYGSLTAAMCALAGPRHGKANQECLEFVHLLIKKLGANATEDTVKNEISRMLDNNEIVFGFGHAVLRVEDPRASIFYSEAQKLYPDNPLVKMALTLRAAGPDILKQNPKVSDPFPNVDAISGSFLSASGFPYPHYFTVLFGLSRCIGISRQITYERLEARDGKGVPIYRPKFFYKQPSS